MLATLHCAIVPEVCGRILQTQIFKSDTPTAENPELSGDVSLFVSLPQCQDFFFSASGQISIFPVHLTFFFFLSNLLSPLPVSHMVGITNAETPLITQSYQKFPVFFLLAWRRLGNILETVSKSTGH